RDPGHRTVRESLLHLDVHHGDILPAGVGLRKMSGGFGIHRRLADQRPEVPGAGVKLATEHAFDGREGGGRTVTALTVHAEEIAPRIGTVVIADYLHVHDDRFSLASPTERNGAKIMPLQPFVT